MDVDAQDGRKKIAAILPGAQFVRRVGSPAVTTRDVEIPVRAEFQAAAIVAASQPGDENLLAGRIDVGRIRVAYPKPRDAGPFRLVAPQHVAEVDEAVHRKIGIEGDSIDVLQLRHQFPEREKQVGALHRIVLRKRVEVAAQLDDDEAIRIREPGGTDRVAEPQARKGVPQPEGQSGLRRADHARGGPWLTRSTPERHLPTILGVQEKRDQHPEYGCQNPGAPGDVRHHRE